jgi:hypothetical protein
MPGVVLTKDGDGDVLVLVSFVLVLVAAVTLVVGLLQSGLTLIYLSIASSVLAGVVLAVAVLRGRPEARPATVGGRAFSPPSPAASTQVPAASTQVPAGVGASSSSSGAGTSSWAAPTSPGTAASAPPPPPPSPSPSGASPSTQAAGAALLGRLRRKSGEASKPETPSEPVAAGTDDGETPAAADATAGDGTREIPLGAPAVTEDDDGFPIAQYDRMRATELMAQLPSLDRNQLEAVRQRESAGKNRFTIMSRVDTLLAASEEPAWEVADDDWDDEAAAAPEVEVVELVEVDDVEVDEVGEPAGDTAFPIAGYDTLTVGQILPRLGELGPDELAAVREREAQGRNRGTVLDRVDRLAARSAPAPLAMPAAAPSTRAGRPRKAPAQVTQRAPAAAAKKAPARKAGGRSAAEASPVTAMKEAVAKAAAKTSAAKAAVAEKVSKKRGGDDDEPRTLSKAPGGKAQAAKATKAGKASKEATPTRRLTKAPGAKATPAKKASKATKK